MNAKFRLSNWPVFAKVLAAPLLATVLLGVLAAYAAFTMQGQKARVESLSNDHFEEYRQVADGLQRLTTAHTKLYRLINVATVEIDETKLKGSVEDARHHLDQVDESLERIRGLVFADSGEGDSAAPLEALRSQMRVYDEVARDVVEQAVVDVANATMLLNDADTEFDRLAQLLHDLSARTKAATLAAAGEVQADLGRATVVFVLVALGTAALAVFASLLFARAIRGPVRRLTRAMADLANGDLDTEVPHAGQADEIGAMARAVEVFKTNGIERERLAAAQAAEREAKERRAETVGQLIRGFDSEASGIIEMVASSATELEATARAMTATAERGTHQAATAAHAAEQTSTNVQTVAGGAEELAATVREILEQVNRSQTIADRATKEAATTNETVTGLVDAAQRIGEVVDLIQGIAAQTNLLALNATIEAARAGEAGKGFAVVAGEVKNLANQTARATEEIARQIQAIQTVSSDSAAAIRGIGETIQEMNQIAVGVAAAMEQQGAATREIARNVHEAAVGTSELSSGIAEVREATGETGAAASQVLAASGELSRQSENLKNKVEHFLGRIRTA